MVCFSLRSQMSLARRSEYWVHQIGRCHSRTGQRWARHSRFSRANSSSLIPQAEATYTGFIGFAHLEVRIVQTAFHSNFNFRRLLSVMAALIAASEPIFADSVLGEAQERIIRYEADDGLADP